MTILKTIALSVLLAMPVIGNANSVFNLNTVSTSASFGNTVQGVFEDTWNFDVLDNNGIGVSATNIAVTIEGAISGFSATLDGNALSPVSTGSPLLQLLTFTLPASAAGSHSLVLGGDAGIGSSYGGSISVSAVPVPAAAWLMGSALVGLVSFGRRKTDQNA